MRSTNIVSEDFHDSVLIYLLWNTCKEKTIDSLFEKKTVWIVLCPFIAIVNTTALTPGARTESHIGKNFTSTGKTAKEQVSLGMRK